MLYTLSLALPLLMLPLSGLAKETVHGAVIFSRHGDRTAKILPPTVLTALGKNQLYNSGSFYRSRYIDANSPTQITGISVSNVVSSQLYAAAPDQDLLINSGQAFLQGLYPPSSSAQTLANGSTITPPLSGYQYTTLHTISTTDPSTIWLKGDDECPKYTDAGEGFYVSEQYTELQASTKSFYESFSDILDGLYTRDGMGYIDAYSIFDYINVGVIHNDTIASRVTAAELFQLRTLADSQQWAFNGNITSPANPGVLPVGGRTLANKIVAQLSSIIDSNGAKNKLSLLVGSYDTFLSFFALSQLPSANKNFFGLPDYAGTLAFELLSYSSDSAFPKDSKDLYVRFLFRNGTNSASPLSEYPLFGRGLADAVMPWADFRDAMAGISVSSVSQWCTVCGSTDSFCPVNSSSTTTETPHAQANQKSNDLSPPVAGVVGAIVTLVAIGVAMVLAMVVFGFRFAKSKGGLGAEEKLGSAPDLRDRSSMGSSVDKSGVYFPDKAQS